MAANKFGDVDLLQNLNYLPGPAQRRSQHRLYNCMEEVDIPNFDTNLFSSTENVYLPRMAMPKAGAPQKKAQKKKWFEKANSKRLKKSRK